MRGIRFRPTGRQIFLAIFSIVAVLIAREIYTFKKLYALAAQVPAFQEFGEEGAPITIIEFVDYNCPFCRQLHPVVQDAIKDRQDIRYIARPIGPLGAESEDLVKVTLAAGKQDAFWEMHDAFLRHDAKLGDVFIRTAAQRAGIDPDRMLEDAKSEEVAQYLKDNVVAASVLGIRFTPSLMINRTIYVPNKGIPSVEEMGRIIDSAAR